MQGINDRCLKKLKTVCDCKSGKYIKKYFDNGPFIYPGATNSPQKIRKEPE